VSDADNSDVPEEDVPPAAVPDDSSPAGEEEAVDPDVAQEDSASGEQDGSEPNDSDDADENDNEEDDDDEDETETDEADTSSDESQDEQEEDADEEDDEVYEADTDDSDTGHEDEASSLQGADADADAEFSEAEIGEVAASCPSPKAPGKPAKPKPAAPAKGNLLVTVINSKTGKTIKGAAVKIAGPEPHNGPTDASGQIRFSGIATGAYTADGSIDGFAPGSKAGTVKPNATTRLTIKLPPAAVSMTVDGVAAGNKISVGGLIVRNFDGNSAPRKKITISAVTPAGAPGDVILQCASAKVKFFDAAVAGSEVKIDGAANRFAPGVLPKDVFVEGMDASDTMRDIRVTLDHGTRTTVDSARLTVIWVDKPTVNLAGRMSKNNSKRKDYIGWTVAGTSKLGLQRYNAKFGARMGWGSEASAKVHPTKFQFPGNDLKLERDFDFKDYNGAAMMASGARSASVPPGNDTGPAAARDDNPKPDDKIYDWDAAGLNVPVAPVGTIHRTRNNFWAFASITAEGKSVRCSEIREYFIAFSQEQKKAPSGDKWRVKKPPDVAGDNTSGNGTTNLTWDLT
jgi:hypothetical protein